MSNNRPTKKMINKITAILLILVIVTVSVCSYSLVRIMIIDGEKYQSMATKQQLYDTRITAERGNIYDRNGEVLATSAPIWTVFVTPNSIAEIKDEKERERVTDTISKGLSPILGITEEEIDEKLAKTQTYYVAIKQKIENDVANKVRDFLTDNKDLNLSAYVGLDQSTKRYYTDDNLASTVLGFVGSDNQGLSGIELKYDDELTGTPGRIVAAKNALGTDMPFTYEKKIDAKAGNSVYLTIDEYIQYVTEKYLDEAVKNNKVGERGAAIVMNVKTAEVLAMAVKGDFNPNEYLKLSAEDQASVDRVTDTEEKQKLLSDLRNKQWRNKNISDPYEPGSVFKIITESIGLD
ncbi:MAG: stage V sporulation protein D, partial [Oscillospiraceae bacterium]|nr:stage V sporulation protein D [Candidatus Equicaccousia limihippi]